MEDIFASLKDVVVSDDCWEFVSNQDFFGNPIGFFCNPNKDRIWITNGKESVMIFPDDKIPSEWYKGRTFQFSKKGKKANLKQLKENNPNARKYKIIFRDGTEEIVKQLSSWARKNGHNYSTIKSIVHRTKYKKQRQYVCYNSPTYYIKEIWIL